MLKTIEMNEDAELQLHVRISTLKPIYITSKKMMFTLGYTMMPSRTVTSN